MEYKDTNIVSSRLQITTIITKYEFSTKKCKNLTITELAVDVCRRVCGYQLLIG